MFLISENLYHPVQIEKMRRFLTVSSAQRGHDKNEVFASGIAGTGRNIGMARAIFISIIILWLLRLPVFGQSLIEPIRYPLQTTSNSRPWIIWQDIYSERKSDQYRLNLYRKSDDVPHRSYTFTPALYYKFFYAYRLPDFLEDNRYHYSIERIVKGESIESRYYYYLNYPLVGEFEIDSLDRNELDFIPPAYLIQYLYIDRNNVLRNGYNTLFFTTSSAATFAIGLLFYHVIHLGTISTIIYYICFISSGVGLSAAGYYGYRYIENRGKLQKILEIGKGISINGGIIDQRVNTEVELKF